MEIAEKPELPHHKDFYYDFEYTLENIEGRFWEVLKDKFWPEDEKRIKAALKRAKNFHRCQFRIEMDKDGLRLPYIIHPIEVATEVMELGGSPDEVIAALFHDVREDVKWMRELKNGEVAREFQSRVVEVLTRLLSKYRFKNDEVVKLSINEYFLRLSSDTTAVWIKALDRRKNLMSLGRILNHILLNNQYSDFTLVKKQIEETREIVIPIVYKKYSKLAKNLEELTLKLETRFKIVENFNVKQSAQFLKLPASMQLGA